MFWAVGGARRDGRVLLTRAGNACCLNAGGGGEREIGEMFDGRGETQE